MFSTTDTIVAIATPPGRGGIGVVRLSGSDAHAIARRLAMHPKAFAPRRATFTRLALDQAIVTYFPAPASYTGEDVIELSAHGSPVVLRAIVASAMSEGARLAEPGEFTLRAYVNGRIDLMQAEAVADLIDSVTPLQARTAFDQLNGTLTTAIGEIDAALFDLVARLEASVDFPDEGYHFIDPQSVATAIDHVAARTQELLSAARRGRIFREGLQVAIIGRPNAGKSSLFNALVGTGRAIVSATPGTTRDMVAETIDLDGLSVTLVDTAGLREASDPVEVEGVERSIRAAKDADVTLLVVDRSAPAPAGHIFGVANISRLLTVASKSDLPAAWQDPQAVAVSATTGAGLDELRRRIAASLDVEPGKDRPAISNVRHVALVDRAHAALIRAREAAQGAAPLTEEFVLADLQDARAAFEEVTGKRTPDDVLEAIFSRFCIGK